MTDLIMMGFVVVGAVVLGAICLGVAKVCDAIERKQGWYNA